MLEKTKDVQLDSRYSTPYLPTEEELAEEIDRKKNVQREQGMVYGEGENEEVNNYKLKKPIR